MSHQTSATKNIEKPHCNPIGYFKNEDQDICIHSDGLEIDKTDLVKRKRCNGGREQQWAINGSHICHSVRDKCFTVTRNQGTITLVALEPYNASDETQKWQWNKETSQIETKIKIKKGWPQFCMQVSTEAFDYYGFPFFEPMPCDKNKWSQKWTFTPVVTAVDNQECAKFEERGGIRRNGVQSMNYT